MQWHAFSYQTEERAAQLYANAFPIRIVQMTMLGVPWWIRLVHYSLFHPRLPKNIRATMVYITQREAWLQAPQWPKSVLAESWGGTLKEEENGTLMILDMLRERYENAAKLKI